MKAAFLKVATGRSGYSLLFLVAFMLVAPAAIFTDYSWLDHLGWFMLIVLGLFILVTGIVTYQEGKDSRQWPTAIASSPRYSLTWHTSKNSRRYRPKVECTFEVAGQEFTGVEYDFSSNYTSKEKAQALLDEVKLIQPLTLHYKPTDPTVNVIYPGPHFVHYARVFIGVAMMVIGALSWMGVIRY